MSQYALILNKNGMGHAPQALSHTLIKNYLQLLSEQEQAQLPAAICCYGEGIFLCCSGSPVIPSLQRLQERGCVVIVCKTCLSYFEQENALETGTVGTMTDILGVQLQASKTLTL